MDTYVPNKVIATEQPYMAAVPPSDETTLAKVMHFENKVLSFFGPRIRALLLFMDWYPFTPRPKVGGVDGVRSMNGGLGSIVMMLLIAWHVSYTIIIYVKRDATVNSLSAPIPSTNKYYADVIFGATSDAVFWNPDYMNVRVFQETSGNATGSVRSEEIFYKSCNPLGKSISENNTFCLRSGSPNGPVYQAPLQGSYGSDVFSSLLIKVSYGSLCNHYTSRNLVYECVRNNSAMYNTWLNAKFNVGFLESRLFGEIGSSTMFMQYIDVGWASSADVFATPVDISDSSNIIFGEYVETPSTAKYIRLSDFISSDYLVYEDPSIVFTIRVQIAATSQVISLNYITTLDLISQWGGFCSLMWSWFYSLLYVYNRARFRYYYTWDIEPFMNVFKTRNQHRVIVHRYIPVDTKGIPMVPTYPTYKPPETDSI